MATTHDADTFAALVARAREAKTAYDHGDLLMADAEYDLLLDEISTIEAEHPEWTDGASITEVVETLDPDAAKVAHERPMLSLAKVHEDLDALLEWVRRTGAGGVVVQSKYDGMAVSALYENGELVRLATRGTGEVGDDITFAAHQVQGLPKRLPAFSEHPLTDRFEVRGEVVMDQADFVAANEARTEHGDRPFVNKRNGTVGAMRGAKDRDYLIAVRLFAYEAIDLTDAARDLTGLALDGNGFIAADSEWIVGESVFATAIPQAIAKIERKRALGDVDLDGAVVKVDSAKLRQELGATGHHPRWALAYKFPPEEKSTTLLDVLWQVGRTGLITPRAVFEPVFVGGSLITYATLHNPDEIERMDVRIGDRVMVRRAGDVIPRLEGVLISERDGTQTPVAAPQVCPQCGGEIDRSEARWRCENGASCGLGRLIDYATGREAWDIEGVGGTIASSLASEAVVQSISDVLALTVEQIASLPRRDKAGRAVVNQGGSLSTVGATVAQKIVSQIDTAKALPLHRHLTALGIRSTGRRMSRTLARHFGTMEALRAATFEDMLEVEMVGAVKAVTIMSELDRLSGDIDRLVELGITTVEPTDTAEGLPQPLAGMTVVATGSFARWDRKGVQEAIEAAGGKVGSSVSKSTDLLVAGEKAGSKRAKAEGLNVRILDEDEFAAMVGV